MTSFARGLGRGKCRSLLLPRLDGAGLTASGPALLSKHFTVIDLAARVRKALDA